MKASELRIGNLVYTRIISYHKDSICSISGCNHKGIFVKYGNGHIIPQNLQPIPLTEEWLLKCGFAYIDNPQGYKLQIIKENLYEDIYGLDIIALVTWEEGDVALLFLSNHTNNLDFQISRGKCEHVHQLQNLYFALTGQELEVK
jgi:hypothetical protein